MPDVTARVLLAAGRGPARLPSCEHAVRHERLVYFVEGTSKRVDVRPLLRRALLLFGPGELRALCVADGGVIDFVASVLQVSQAGAAHSSTALDAPRLGRALVALSAVAWPNQPKQLDAEFALIERHAATITALDCPTRSKSVVAERALARCTRLQSLSHVGWYAPTSWLQCTQLHTLRNVDLTQASVAAIAAALPRLHTLAAAIWIDPAPAGAVAGFFEDLLPRLRVFRFYGTWPWSREGAAGITAQPLPLLQELVWGPISHHAEARGFIGAQPVTLDTSHEVIADWFAAADGDDIATNVDGTAAGGPLARVRDLRVSGMGSSETSDMARMLRAAPHLRALSIISGLVDNPFSNMLARPDPCPVTLTHGRVRSVVIQSRELRSPTADAATRLRERHFPRLRELTVNSHQYHDVPLTVEAAREMPAA
jgi:hypothetical protein